MQGWKRRERNKKAGPKGITQSLSRVTFNVIRPCEHIMSRMKRAAAIFCLLCAVSPLGIASQQATSPWDDYIPRTLQSIIEAHRDVLSQPTRAGSNPDKQVALSADSFPSKVNLIFTGQSRPLSDAHAKLLENWSKMLRINDDLTAAFGTEMLFKEGAQEFWMPVQGSLVNDMSTEVKAGRSFTAYVVWVGAVKANNQWDWVFALNAYDSSPDKLPSPKPAH